MLGDKAATTTIAVTDLERALRFYEGTLGLKKVQVVEDQGVILGSGNSTILVYKSEFAGTNKATAMTWMVGDEVESLAAELKAKGVQFETYDMPGMTVEGGLYVGFGMKTAWFKDPDGNILNIVNG